MSKKYKIGTRGSLLAVTQSTQVKQALEDLTGDEFELIKIKTKGDLNTQVPLWQLEGKDFFTRELDEALLKQEIDLVIHSYKDLGSERPSGIQLAAVTQRQFAHDILLIKKSTVLALNKCSHFRIGTSSPRRTVNIENHLKDLIPFSHQMTLEVIPLRGNVNTRIAKLVSGEYEAIVLALAGIERLASSESSLAELKKLLYQMDFCILPASLFPPAASQGALGIECLEKRDDNGELLSKLKKLEHAPTIAEVSRERSAFKAYGGGCHLAVGVYVKKWKQYFIHYHRGVVDGQVVNKREVEGLITPKLKITKAFIGMPGSNDSTEIEYIYDHYIKKSQINMSADSVTKLQTQTLNTHGFVTSRYCIELAQKLSSGFIGLWASGTQTWKSLAQAGLWVNGTSDSLGESELEVLLESQVIQLLTQQNKNTTPKWSVFSHQQSRSQLAPVVIAAYEHLENTQLPVDYEDQLKACDVFYWTSFTQYQAFTKRFGFIKKDKLHACGLGKTFDRFNEEKINIAPFISLNEFKNWVNKNKI